MEIVVGYIGSYLRLNFNNFSSSFTFVDLNAGGDYTTQVNSVSEYFSRINLPSNVPYYSHIHIKKEADFYCFKYRLNGSGSFHNSNPEICHAVSGDYITLETHEAAFCLILY